MGEHLISLFGQALTVLCMALTAIGAYEVQQEGMILERLGKFWHKQINSSFWEKPFWTCPVCMVSVWGIPVWFFVTNHPIEFIHYLPLHLFAAAGLAAYLNR